MNGKIEVICGPMFSGKSEELLRRLKRAEIAKRKYVLVKPIVDDRYSKDEVVSHSGRKLPCYAIKSPWDVFNHIDSSTKIVAFDEAQFFDGRIMRVINLLVEKDIRIIIAGLDMDSKGAPFGSMPKLMAIAEEVHKITAVCEVCGDPATHTHRLSKNVEQFLIGAGDHYQARCRSHWKKELDISKNI